MSDPDPVTAAILRGMAQKEAVLQTYRVDLNSDGSWVSIEGSESPFTRAPAPEWVRFTQIRAKDIDEAKEYFLDWAEHGAQHMQIVLGDAEVDIDLHVLARDMRARWGFTKNEPVRSPFLKGSEKQRPWSQK